MNDILLDALGNYFVDYAVMERFGYTFTQFIELYETGRWIDPMMVKGGYIHEINNVVSIVR